MNLIYALTFLKNLNFLSTFNAIHTKQQPVKILYHTFSAFYHVIRFKVFSVVFVGAKQLKQNKFYDVHIAHQAKRPASVTV